MSLRFISTEVLSSTDGLSHGETEKLETDEVAAAKRLQDCSSGKTLFDQLEAEKAKQQEAYDANTKAIFAPNQALDDEEVEFFESEKKREAFALAARDEIEASEFASARASLEERGDAAPGPGTKPAIRIAPAPVKAKEAPVPKLKIRRRPVASGEPPQKSEPETKRPKTEAAAPPPTNSLAALMGSYAGSSSDDDSD